MKKLLCISIIFSAMLIFGCKKEDPIHESPLPPATQEGANTFGCMINGEPWRSGIDCCIFDPIIREFNVAYDEPGFGIADNYYINIIPLRINFTDSLDQRFRIGLRPIKTTGKVNFKDLKRKKIEFSTGQADGLGRNTRFYELDTLSPIHFEITAINTGENFISGLFEFNLIEINGSDTLEITEGRFDLKYQPD